MTKFFAVFGCLALLGASCNGGGEEADKTPPVIEHTEVADGQTPGTAIPVEVTATDKSGIEKVTLFFRTSGENDFGNADLTEGENGGFTGEIPAVFVKAPGVDYYFEATDGSPNANKAFLPDAAPQEVFSFTVVSSQEDTDGDGKIDSEDNCPEAANPGQEDMDGDDKGDACDKDADGDGAEKPADCDDMNPEVNPGKTEGPPGDETCADTADNDCDGKTDGEDPGCFECFNDGECSDGVDCTIDKCEDGACSYESSDALCDDGNPCTIDSCDAESGCVRETDTDFVPDDGLECTVDSCETGEPVHTPVDASCDDGNPCTDDLCDAEEDCQAVEDDTNVPDDGVDCTLDACEAGEESHAPADDLCDDGNPCTDDLCDAEEDCQVIEDDTNVPNDGVPCTVDVCSAGEEGHAPADDLCDDGNPCTDDFCDAGDDCYTVNNDAVVPDDGLDCTIDSCSDGVEDHYPDHDACDDENPCTDNFCDPLNGDAQTGCRFPNNDELVPPADGHECTVESCGAGVEKHDPSDAYCNDGEWCDGEETCVPESADLEGGCKSGTPPDCDDENTCTEDSCVEGAPGHCDNVQKPEAKEGPVGYASCFDSEDNDCDTQADGDDPDCGSGIDWANLQHPASIIVAVNTPTEDVFGRIYEPGKTEGEGPNADIKAQLGYGPAGSDPTDNAGWTWIDAAFNVDVVNDDEYKASLTISAAGTYAYAYRYSIDSEATWVYADLDGNGIPQNSAGGNGFQLDKAGSLEVKAVAAGDVIISEIMKNPKAVGDTDGEWFEIHNTTSWSININGWTLKDIGAVKTHVITNVDPLVVGGGDFKVLARKTAPEINGGIAAIYQYSSIDLVNSGSDGIAILADATEVDQVTYDNTFPNVEGASMSLNPEKLTYTDNDAAANWCSATFVLPSGDMATPGAANDACTE